MDTGTDTELAVSLSLITSTGVNTSTVIKVLVLLALVATTPVFGDQTTTQDVEDSQSAEKTIEAKQDAAAPQDGKKPKKQKDPNRGRILPIPIFITEPAVGDGLGLVIAYFHRKKETPEGTTIASPGSIGELSREQAPPPTVTGIFGAYTSNETKAGGIGHMNSFRDDHIRFTALAAYADVNSTFYLLDQPFKFNLDGFLAYQETRVRIKDSRWFWGIGLSYLDANTSFRVDLPEDAPIDLFGVDIKNVGLSGKLAWDSRDNTSMPNSGQFIDLSLWRYDEALGGDYDYWNAKLKLLSFHQLHEKFVLGVRFEYSAVDGQVPFFGVPWVSLRGIPAMRYQGDQVAVAEIEGRYNFSHKWAMVGFTGIGKVNSYIPIFDTQQDIYNFGLGGRYKIFDAQNVWVGVDIAKGPEDYAWYIQVGQAW
jgi:hypothetical protein